MNRNELCTSPKRTVAKESAPFINITDISPNEAYNKISFFVRNCTEFTIKNVIFTAYYISGDSIAYTESEACNAVIPSGKFAYDNYTIQTDIHYERLLLEITGFYDTNEIYYEVDFT